MIVLYVLVGWGALSFAFFMGWFARGLVMRTNAELDELGHELNE